MLDDRTKKLLSDANLAFLGTVDPDGSPQVTPVWIDTDGDYVLFNTATGRAKERNLRRDPRVAIAVTPKDNFYDMVEIRGVAEEFVTGDEADRHIDKLSEKYLGVPDYQGHRAGEQRVIVKVRPTKVLGR
jgi:PPOX class probable F420-dependent enzyme